jgi:adenylosuccinate synthase
MITSRKNKVDMIIDLQYGSTGKGLIAGYLAMKNDYDTIITANMPNAGHTFIDSRGNKMIHKVLGNGVVGMNVVRAMIGPGAVFSPVQLAKELNDLEDFGYHRFFVCIHSNAVVLKDQHKFLENGMSESIGSTQQGSMAAMISKLNRDPASIVTIGQHIANRDALKELEPLKAYMHRIVILTPREWAETLLKADNILAEGAQGFSLGVNEQFYPYCTSRDCTPARFMADMSIPLPMLRKVIGTARTWPIRVAGNSGNCYPDQHETTWPELGLEEELTTVTKKVRRVFSFSKEQMFDAVSQCQPNEVFLNFCNYPGSPENIIKDINWIMEDVGPDGAKVAYTGWGPTINDINYVGGDYA